MAQVQEARKQALQSNPTLENQAEVLEEWIAKLKNELKNASSSEDNRAIENALKNTLRKLSLLKGKNSIYHYFMENCKDQSIVAMTDRFDAAAPLVKVVQESSKAAAESKDFFAGLKNSLSKMNEEIEELKSQAARGNSSEKRLALNEEIKLRSSQILTLLPPPGTEGSFGEPSLWSNLPKDERMAIFKEMHRLEHLFWEAHMKLAKGEMSGKERFLLLKAQAIRFAILRKEADVAKYAFESFITPIYETDKKAKIMLGGIVEKDPKKNRLKFSWSLAGVQKLSQIAGFVKTKKEEHAKLLTLISNNKEENEALIPKAEEKKEIENLIKISLKKRNAEAFQNENGKFFWDPETEGLEIKWETLTQDEWEEIEKELLDSGLVLSESNALPNPGLLLLDNYTMDTELANQLLTQDLTAGLSNGAEMEKDLLAVYHFIVKDQNRGYQNWINLPSSIKQRNANYSAGFARRPFMLDVSQGVSLETEAAFRNPFTTYDKSKLQSQLPNEQERSEIYELLDILERGEFYYRTATDPDFCLYNQQPTIGVSFFQSNPEALLSQNTVDVKVSADNVQIIGDSDTRLADVFTHGKRDVAYIENEKDSYSEEDIENRIRPKKPFLPVVDNDPSDKIPSFSDIRQYKPFEVWMEYVTEKSLEGTLSIPPQALQKLFQIRHEPNDNKNKVYSTTYSPDTALRALSFIADGNNQRYLKHDFVQQYLEESLFGQFVMQQAIVEHPELIRANLELIFERITEAAETGNLEAVGFLTNLFHNRFQTFQFKRIAWRFFIAYSFYTPLRFHNVLSCFSGIFCVNTF